MGVAIVVDGVDWSAKAVAQVTIVEDDSDIPAEVVAMYNAYIAKAGRAENIYLKRLLNDLHKNGLLSKCTELFYLASIENNIEHIKYNVINLSALTGSGTPIISSNGLGSNSSYSFTPAGNVLTGRGALVVSVISTQGTTNNIDWGRDTTGASFFSSKGYGSGVIFQFSNTALVTTSDDSLAPDGVYSIYIKDASSLYKHEGYSKSINAAAHTGTWTPLVLKYPTVAGFSTAIHKVYATFNNDLTEVEVSLIHSIFRNYKNLL